MIPPRNEVVYSRHKASLQHSFAVNPPRNEVGYSLSILENWKNRSILEGHQCFFERPKIVDARVILMLYTHPAVVPRRNVGVYSKSTIEVCSTEAVVPRRNVGVYS